jgi:glycosyltransferase involved in cell wall biosynthesis
VACRLLYLLGQLRPGGQERQLYYLLHAMDRERYQPAIAVWNYSTREDGYVREVKRLGVPLYSCSDAASAAAKLAELRRLVIALKPEVTHSYCFYTNVVAWWATQGSRAISIGSIRQDFIGERRLGGLVGTILGRLSARLPAIQIANSWMAKRSAEQSKGFFKPNQIHVVPNGVDIDKITPSPIGEDGSLLLAVGRLDPEKRWDRLLRVVGLLAPREFDFYLRLAGDGPLLDELQMQARHLGIDRRVQFLGFRHDIPNLLKHSLFLIHTADAEGCPNVVLEAMASGRAVVATDAGDVPHIVEDGKTGFVVPRGDDLKLLECLAKLLSDRDLCRRMGEAGRAKVEREFGLDRLVSKTLAAYEAAGWNR